MKAFVTLLALSAASAVPAGFAESSGDSLPMISLPAPKAKEASQPPQYPKDARFARVRTWIDTLVSACPSEAANAAAKAFLEDLMERSGTTQIDQLLASAEPPRDIQSALLREIAANLSGTAEDGLRKSIARQRIQLVIEKNHLPLTSDSKGADTLLERIGRLSEARLRSLLEGRMEDDDLVFYLKRTGDVNTQAPSRLAGSGELTAKEIVAEFGRRNQNGTMMQRLQSYVIESRLKTAAGQEQRIFLFKLRPEFFRLAVFEGKDLLFIEAGNGTRFWMQQPGAQLKRLTKEKIGPRRYYSEFVDPLLDPDSYAFERLPDGAEGDIVYYRLRISRPDGSAYIARIDRKSYRQIANEQNDGTVIRYSDFREVGGLTLPFREEIADREGRKGTLETLRVTPNPCLIREFFEAPGQDEQGYLEIERLLAQAKPAR